jgi:hypothetical protein
VAGVPFAILAPGDQSGNFWAHPRTPGDCHGKAELYRMMQLKLIVFFYIPIDCTEGGKRIEFITFWVEKKVRNFVAYESFKPRPYFMILHKISDR